MTDLTIVYLKMRALAEAPQLMLSYRDQPHNYRMAWDYFGAPGRRQSRACHSASCRCW